MTDKPLILELTDEQEEKWNYLQQMRAEKEKLEAGIDRAEAFFSELMKAKGAVGLSVNGVQKVQFEKNATFAARKFQDENPHLAKQFMVTRETFDATRFKEVMPEMYAAYQGYSFKYVKPKKGSR